MSLLSVSSHGWQNVAPRTSDGVDYPVVAFTTKKPERMTRDEEIKSLEGRVSDRMGTPSEVQAMQDRLAELRKQRAADPFNAPAKRLKPSVVHRPTPPDSSKLIWQWEKLNGKWVYTAHRRPGVFI